MRAQAYGKSLGLEKLRLVPYAHPASIGPSFIIDDNFI
jgi:hypothetical protein